MTTAESGSTTAASSAEGVLVSDPFVATCWLIGDAYCGIYYMSTPTITMGGNKAGLNQGGTLAIGSTAWTVFDLDHNVVGVGTMAASATSITICSSGTWIGGAGVEPGFFTVVTNPGTNGVVVGNCCICPPSRGVYIPDASGDQQWSLSAWLGGSDDRDFYSIPAFTPAELLTQYRADPYFTATQDPARPRKLWIASSEQPNDPTQTPSPAQWAAVATEFSGAGITGLWYECPCNEPENGGWSTTDLISYWQACQSAILAVDSTAHVMGWCSAGIYASSPLSRVATFLASCPVAVFTNHMEDSDQNMSNLVALRQYCQGLKTQFAASGYPDMDYWNSETGIEGGQYGCLQPRREARQRTYLSFVYESFGWAKEQQYNFEVWDHHGSGLPMYMVDNANGLNTGNLRAGAYALHVYAEALWGTSCSPTNPPDNLNFGPSGSVGYSLFMGLHYTAYSDSTQDVVVLASDVAADLNPEVILEVSTTGTVTYWDGMGRPGTVTVTNGQITIPLSDLLSYVFLPPNTTVSVIDTDAGAVSFSQPSTVNVAAAATVVNEVGTNIPIIHNGSFAENNSGVIAGDNTLYNDTTIPSTVNVSKLDGANGAQSIDGFALATSGPAWQGVGCSITSFTLGGVVNGEAQTLYSYTNPSAISYPIPSASIGNSSDICSRTTWWNGPWAWLVKFDEPVLASSLTLTVTGTSYGGQPDLAASQNATSSYNESVDPQRLSLSEFQIYSNTFSGSAQATSSAQGSPQHALNVALSATEPRAVSSAAAQDTRRLALAGTSEATTSTTAHDTRKGALAGSSHATTNASAADQQGQPVHGATKAVSTAAGSPTSQTPTGTFLPVIGGTEATSHAGASTQALHRVSVAGTADAFSALADHMARRQNIAGSARASWSAIATVGLARDITGTTAAHSATSAADTETFHRAEAGTTTAHTTAGTADSETFHRTTAGTARAASITGADDAKDQLYPKSGTSEATSSATNIGMERDQVYPKSGTTEAASAAADEGAERGQIIGGHADARTGGATDAEAFALVQGTDEDASQAHATFAFWFERTRRLVRIVANGEEA